MARAAQEPVVDVAVVARYKKCFFILEQKYTCNFRSFSRIYYILSYPIFLIIRNLIYFRAKNYKNKYNSKIQL